MKILEVKYPLGSLKNQKAPGRYIDAFLYANLKVMAEKITSDMTFLGVIFSSTLEVGTGKSVLATQIGEAWELLIKEIHGIDLHYGLDNIVWRPKELIDRAFKVPKYSYLLLDEWEDAHYWSELGMTFRQFFRKCRQLNLFIMVIIPNWFQLPINYAISRSIFAIDVKFGDNFERGFFDFYGFDAKKNLYVKGKKFNDYKVTKPDFDGKFYDGYGVNEDEYRKKKREDMEKWDDDEQKPKVSQYALACGVVKQVYKYFKGKKGVNMTEDTLAEALGKNRRTISYMLTHDSSEGWGDVPPTTPIADTPYNLHRRSEVKQDEEEEEDNQID
jgi:hypothetical protein